MSESALKQPVPGLRFFESLAKGERAPRWLHNGICAVYGLRSDSLITLISVSENASYLVEGAAGPIGVLRLQQPGYQESEAQLRSELDWVEAIHTSGCARVPRPVPGADGQKIHSVCSPEGEVMSLVMYEFVSGSILQDVDNPAPWFVELGQITARLHEQSRSWKRPPEFDRFTWGLSEMIGPRARWGNWRRAELTAGQRALLEGVESAASNAINAVEKSPRNWGLIHSDLRPTNVIHDGNRLTVIDFDDSGFGWFMYDFAAALTFQEHGAFARAMAGNWIRGYLAESELDDADVALGCHLSMIRSLTMLGWSTSHRPDALPPTLEQAGVVEAACVLAERYEASPTWLID